MEPISLVTLLVAGASAFVAGIIDVRTLRVPNMLTLPVLFAGLAFHLVTSGLEGLHSAFVGAVCAFAVMFLLFLIGVMGAGDVKLMAALGAWLGMSIALYVLLVASLCNAVFSLIMLFRQGGLRRVYMSFQLAYLQLTALSKFVGEDERIENVVKHQEEHQGRLVPFAAMIALGVTAVAAWHLLPLSPPVPH